MPVSKKKPSAVKQQLDEYIDMLASRGKGPSKIQLRKAELILLKEVSAEYTTTGTYRGVPIELYTGDN